MNQSKFLLFFGSLLLVCLICTLSLMDANAYVYEHYIDVCEFLELSGELSETQKTKIIIEVISNLACQTPTGTNDLLRYFYFSPWIKDLLTNVASTQKIPLLVSFYIFSKHIKQYNPLKTLYSPFDDEGSKILIDHQENISYSTKNCLPLQTHRIINTSILRS